MFSNAMRRLSHCKSWGVDAPQGLGFGSAQIRDRVGPGPPTPSRLFVRLSVRLSTRPPVHPFVRPSAPLQPFTVL